MAHKNRAAPPSDEAQEGRRLVLASLTVVAVIALGTVALEWVGDGRWPLWDAMYMAIISVSTVGFQELPGLEQVQGGRAVAAGIIMAGLGAVALFQSTLTALVVHGTVGHAWRRRRMRSRVAAMEGHVVVAGVGSTGLHAVEELVATGTPFVAVDRDAAKLERISQTLTGGAMLFVCGDATEDHVLKDAGIERASGLIAALTHDKDNLYVTLSARTFNAKARIVTKVVELEAVPKMTRAGANSTVSPNIMGGRRMASEVARPELLELLDGMLRDRDSSIRLEEVPIPKGSVWVSRSVAEIGFQQSTHVLLVAVRDGTRQIKYNPAQDAVLGPDSVLVVLGHDGDVAALRRLVAASAV